MKHIIIGTAGHVDHGKTTLIKALTGTDTDRLKEEQERGMTIDLGFASMTLADGTLAGIVDVPGHERFLKNMLAGAGGVDVALLVIAADEGIMPQTREHLDILSLLDVRGGVVALTKCGMVEREWLAMVEDDVRAYLRGTLLGEAPVVRVDSVSGKGIPDLKRALLSAASRVTPRSIDAPARLPVDRVFTMSGFGTVATGTLVAGTLSIGDTVAILPEGREARIRGLHVHGQKATTAEAGSRVGVNLAGVDIDDLERGAVLASPGALCASSLLDLTLGVLPTAARPLRDRERVRLYVGTSEVLGRLRMLGGDTIAPGERAYVQFSAEQPVSCARGDRVVVRTYSPMATVAGATVLDASPKRHRRRDPQVLERLAACERGTPEDLVEAWLQSRPFGASRNDASAGTGLTDEVARAAIAALIEAGRAVRLGTAGAIMAPALAAAEGRARYALDAYHGANPLRTGMPREELRAALGRACEPRAFIALVTHWIAEGWLAGDQTSLRLADFQVQLNPRQQALYDKVRAAIVETGIQPPGGEELCRRVGAPPDAVAAMLRVGLDRGELVRIGENYHCHRDAVTAAVEQVRAHLAAHGSITPAQFRDLTGATRKYSVPFLEYLDDVRVTRRVGDVRVLLG